LINPAWLFVLATAIAVIGILFAFKNLMASLQDKIDNGQEIKIGSMQQETTRFFITVAIVEAIPILLIMYGFMQIEKLEGQSVNILLPQLIIIGILIFALIHVLMVRRDTLGHRDESTEETKTIVTTLMFIGLVMIGAIPIVSFVAILLMAG
jgi:uncharacterized membrane protein